LQRSQRYLSQEITSLLLLVLGIIVIGVVLTALLRAQRGIIGVVLGGVAVLILVYWMRELRKLTKSERRRPVAREGDWNYDLIEGGEQLTVVAEVPGPSNAVRAHLRPNGLEIRGGNGFRREIRLSVPVRLAEIAYNNGVLTVRLVKG
jgi:hypothetical protein